MNSKHLKLTDYFQQVFGTRFGILRTLAVTCHPAVKYVKKYLLASAEEFS